MFCKKANRAELFAIRFAWALPVDRTKTEPNLSHSQMLSTKVPLVMERISVSKRLSQSLCDGIREASTNPPLFEDGNRTRNFPIIDKAIPRLDEALNPLS